MKIVRNNVYLELPCLAKAGDEFDLPESHFLPGSVGRVMAVEGQAAGRTRVKMAVVEGGARPLSQRAASQDGQPQQERKPHADLLKAEAIGMTPKERFMRGTERLTKKGGPSLHANSVSKGIGDKGGFAQGIQKVLAQPAPMDQKNQQTANLSPGGQNLPDGAFPTPAAQVGRDGGYRRSDYGGRWQRGADGSMVATAPAPTEAPAPEPKGGDS